MVRVETSVPHALREHMPSALPKPCIERGCPNLTRGTRCEKHEVQRERELDTRRPSATDRGYDDRHREWREQVLDRDKVCRMCGVQPSTVADHITPIRDGGARFDLKNGQGLCTSCHAGPKQSSDRRRRAV